MSNTTTLLDKYKKACSLASDNACAVKLGVTRATVSRWRNDLGHPEADSIEAMCTATGEPVARWLPLIEADRARSPAARKVWLKLAQVAASMLLVVTAAASQRVEAHTISTGFRAIDGGTPVYIMRNCERLRRIAGLAVVDQLTMYSTS
ncbi:DUF3693 domain-containing protein [Dyella sp.]|uniref:DUF3693 domain-containing protein n=1 Tax=Dyella sp. TaxID=1869338 RepID=UPI003F803568